MTDTHRKAGIALFFCLVSGLYVTSPSFGNPGDAACSGSGAISAKLAPLAQGEVAAIQVQEKPKPVPDLAFTTADGAARKLSDYRGRTVLLNLWATWCVPCRLEMPALNAMQAALGGQDFEVLAVNIDTRNPDKPKQFYTEMKIDRLAFYADPSAKVYQDLKAIGKAFGMPTTLLIDKEGCEVAYLAGPAEWSSADALKLVGAALGTRP